MTEKKTNDKSGEILKTGLAVVAVGGAGYGAYLLAQYLFWGYDFPDWVREEAEAIYAKYQHMDEVDNLHIVEGGDPDEYTSEIEAIQLDIDEEWVVFINHLQEAEDAGQPGILPAAVDWFTDELWSMLKTTGIYVIGGYGSYRALKIAMRKGPGAIRRLTQSWRNMKFKYYPPSNQQPPPSMGNPGDPPINPGGGSGSPLNQPTCPVEGEAFPTVDALKNHMHQYHLYDVTSNTIVLENAQYSFNHLPATTKAAIYAEVELMGVQPSWLATYWPLLAAVTLLVIAIAVLGVISAGAPAIGRAASYNLFADPVFAVEFVVGSPSVSQGILAGVLVGA